MAITEPAAYFGLWSARDIEKVTAMLTQLDVRFSTNPYEATEEILKAWCAWDASAKNPNVGYNLWIHHDDVPKVGSKIVDTFLERKFGAP